MFLFPFTSLHEINLDWILDKVKTLVANNEEFNTKADYAVATADEAKDIAEQAAQATIADGAVTTAKIADGAVTTAKLANTAVTSTKIQSNAVQNTHIADNAVNTAKIADNSITTNKIVDDAITNDKIGEVISVANGGTGAADANTALDNLSGIKRIDINSGNALPTSGSLRMSFSSAFVFMLVTFGSSTSRNGLYIIYGSAGSCLVVPVLNASALTFTEGTGYVDIQSSVGSVYGTIMTGNRLSKYSEETI